MDLKKFLPNTADKEKIEHYWALVIEPGWVQAGIWRIVNQKAQVLYTSKDSAWELDSELIESCDSALSSAIQGFPDGYEEPQKTVFGVSYNWVAGGEIKPEFLDKIKKVCKELSLTPVGFVVLPEAISHLVKSEEGSPLNAIILGVYKENIELSLFQLGKLIGTTQIARSVNLTDDVVEGINRLNLGDMLPSRFLIYDGKEADLEEVRQTIINSDWENFPNVKFLHTPKVELIETKKKIFSVALAGASELANVTALEHIEDKEEEAVTEEVPEPKYDQNDSDVSPEELGFLLEKDIQDEFPTASEEDDNLKEVPGGELGATDHAIDPYTKELVEDEAVPEKIIPPPPKSSKFSLAAVIATLNKIFAKRPKIKYSLPKSGGNFNNPIIVGSLILLTLFVAGFALWWSVPKATVTVYVSPQKLVEETEIGITTSGSSDFTNKVLVGNVVETSVMGDRTKDTTGTRTVGDKAKGEVTIYRVGPELSLPAGTAMVGPDKLKFILDNSVTVASGSGITSPGVTTASVVAQEIGAQYNLAAGSTFTLGNYSTGDMEAKNSSAFSGGSSKEVNSVSKDDQTSLEQDLTEELTGKAAGDLSGEIDAGRYFIKESQQVVKDSVEFDHKVGDEANTLKLNLSVKATAFTVDKNDLVKIAEEVLHDKVPTGFVLRGEQLVYSFEPLKSANPAETRFKLKISANLLPDLKTEEISKKIAGKYPKLAQDYLKKEAPGFAKVEIQIRPALPGRLKTLPHLSKNIEVEISAEK